MKAADTAPPSLEKVASVVSAVCRRHPVSRVEAFGSLAKGEAHTGSDVDLLIQFEPDAAVDLFEMGEIKEELEEQLGCHVDLLTRASVEQSTNPYRRQSILASTITVYAR